MKKLSFVAALLACAATLISLAQAQNTTRKPDEGMRIQPTGTYVLKPAVERTPEQMDAFEATYVAPIEMEEPRPRPTIDPVLYEQLKHEANIQPRGIKPGADFSVSPLTIKVDTKFAGASYCDEDFDSECWNPPDVGGAIGKSQFVSVSNDEIEIRSRTGALTKINSLNGFFGYSTEAIYDPRVQWDPEYQRWIVTCLGFPQGTTGSGGNATVQYLFMAISQTSSATGAWWIYALNVNFFGGTGSLYDFDMLGMTQDALIFTGNIFGATSFQGSNLFEAAKARVYGGYGYGFEYWTGLEATLQPADQLFTDQNGYAWLAAITGNNIYMYALGSPSNPGDATLHGPYTVTGVPAFSAPPNAPQPSSCAGSATLDTDDGRFEQTGIQNGDTYYQIHAENLAGFTSNRYYVITGLLSFAPTVSVSNYVYASASSEDWNPSIAADPNGDFAINWSSDDPGTGLLPSENYVDNKGGNPNGAVGSPVYTSASCYNTGTPFRWGDYSSITLDYGAGPQASTTTKLFWVDNETTPSLNFWSTEVAKVVY
jgi:hypothetical protein